MRAELCRALRATRAAERIVRLTQGSAGIEGQAVSEQFLEEMIAKTAEHLLRQS